MASGFENLTPDQRALLDQWLPGAVVERDHSWGLVDRVVLEVTHGAHRFIVKAGGTDDHHMARELKAHLNWLQPWTSRGRAPLLAHHDAAVNLLVTHFLPGHLVEGTDKEADPAAYRQAGELLALLHSQTSVRDDAYEAAENAKSLAWLDKPHRIDRDVEDALRAEIATWPVAPMLLVPTHGDWQPRNWIVNEGQVSVIDFGRAALRPAMSDFARMAAREFLRDAALEAAFLDGYGSDPRDPAAWRRNRVREAVGTAVWAHQVGDEAFEVHGHQMIADASPRRTSVAGHRLAVLAIKGHEDGRGAEPARECGVALGSSESSDSRRSRRHSSCWPTAPARAGSGTP